MQQGPDASMLVLAFQEKRERGGSPAASEKAGHYIVMNAEKQGLQLLSTMK